MRQKLTYDDVLEGIVPITDPDDTMLFAAVKTELLQEIFQDFDPGGSKREYCNVFIVNQPGMRWNQPQRHEIPPEVFADRPTLSLVIPEFAISPHLSHGDLALVFTPAPELCQVDMKIPQLQYAAGLRYLHSGDFVKPIVMLRNGLTEIWGKRIGDEKVPTGRAEKMEGIQWGGAFTHEETFADLDARVVVNFHPEVSQIHVYRPSTSAEPHRFTLDEYTTFEGGNMKTFVQAQTKGPEKIETFVSDRPGTNANRLIRDDNIVEIRNELRSVRDAQHWIQSEQSITCIDELPKYLRGKVINLLSESIEFIELTASDLKAFRSGERDRSAMGTLEAVDELKHIEEIITSDIQEELRVQQSELEQKLSSRGGGWDAVPEQAQDAAEWISRGAPFRHIRDVPELLQPEIAYFIDENVISYLKNHLWDGLENKDGLITRAAHELAEIGRGRIFWHPKENAPGTNQILNSAQEYLLVKVLPELEEALSRAEINKTSTKESDRTLGIAGTPSHPNGMDAAAIASGGPALTPHVQRMQPQGQFRGGLER